MSEVPLFLVSPARRDGAPFRSKVDEFAPRTWGVNLRTPREVVGTDWLAIAIGDFPDFT